MKSASVVIALGTGLGLLAGCAGHAPKPVVDLAAEKAAIEKLLSDQLTETNQPGGAGADGYVSIVSEDIVLLPPNGKRVDGRQAVRDWSLQFTSAKDWSVSWKANRVEVAASGDLAYAIGTYELSLEDANGARVRDTGKFMDGFRKQVDGTWRETVISFNSDLPVGGAPEPKP